MKKNYFTLVLLSLVLIITINCGSGSGSVNVRYVGTSPMGYYEVIMNYNGDSDYHMGQLYGKTLVEQYPDLEARYADPLDLRYALENYSTIDDIANYLSQKKYTFNHLILIGYSNTVKVLENDLEGTRSLRDAESELNAGITWGFPNAIGAVNAFLLKNNHDNFSANTFNTYRWQSIKDQLNLYLPSDNKITVNGMKKITTYYGTDINQQPDGIIMNNITQQIVIYDSKTPGLHVFFRNNRSIGTENNTTSFDVNNPEFLLIPVQF